MLALCKEFTVAFRDDIEENEHYLLQDKGREENEYYLWIVKINKIYKKKCKLYYVGYDNEYYLNFKENVFRYLESKIQKPKYATIVVKHNIYHFYLPNLLYKMIQNMKKIIKNGINNQKNWFNIDAQYWRNKQILTELIQQQIVKNCIPIKNNYDEIFNNTFK